MKIHTVDAFLFGYYRSYQNISVHSTTEESRRQLNLISTQCVPCLVKNSNRSDIINQKDNERHRQTSLITRQHIMLNVNFDKSGSSGKVDEQLKQRRYH